MFPPLSLPVANNKGRSYPSRCVSAFFFPRLLLGRLYALFHKAEFAAFLLDLRLLRECGRHFAERSLADFEGISRWPRYAEPSTW